MSMEYDEELLMEEDSEVIDNSDISYTGKMMFVKLNTQKNWYEEARYKLDKNIKTLKRFYPNLFKCCVEGEELQFLLDKVFTEGFAKTFYITNLTFKTAKERKDVLAIRPLKEGYYLEEALPKNITLIFKGHLEAGFFVIDEIRTGPDSEHRSCEIEIVAQPVHTNIPSGHRDRFLYEILDNSTSLTEYTEKKLSEWEEFISWRKEIAKKKIAGGKYFNVEYDQSKKLINFYMVFEDEEEFKSFRKYLRRDVKVFSNAYSDDPFRFNFSQQNNKRGYDNGVELGKFKRIEESYYLREKYKEMFEEEDVSSFNREDFEESEAEDYIAAALEDDYIEGDYIDEDEIELDDKEAISPEILLKEFGNPYIVVASYELRNEHSDELDESYLSPMDQIKYVNNSVLKEFNKQGFLALSGVGEFALLKRFEFAISQLKKDESNSPNLALWLFNIEHAKLPDENYLEHINEWLNPGIETNKDQMKAVEKILNTQDVTLIQGPPGTGKTTVIAEAIYQFVKRGQRVLVTSQSNDAVDNALERLAETPAIRAIRLGQKNRKKRLKDEQLINKFSEENAIESFYKSISNVLDIDYIKKWDDLEKRVIDYSRHIRDYNSYRESLDQCKREIKVKSDEVIEISNKLEELNKENERIQAKKSYGKRLEYQLKLFKEALLGEEVDFIMPQEQIELIFKNIEPVVTKLSLNGIELLNGLAMQKSLEGTTYNLLLQLIVSNINVLDTLIKKVVNHDSADTSSVDTSIIDAKISNMQADMMSISDENKIMKIIREMQELKKERELLVKQSNSIALTEREKSIFNETGLENIYIDGKVDVNRIKEMLSKVSEISKELKKVLNNLIEDISQTAISMISGDLDVISEIERVKGSLKVLNEELEVMTEKANYFRMKLVELSELYETEVSNVIPRINELQELARQEKEEDALLRDCFEGLIVSFKKRLDDVNNYEYDKQYYEDIYINACNVVGISCTDNMRVLMDKGYNDFDVVIIDEVSKATPPELLIPLMKARKAVLVGDHRQLPPLFNEHEKSYKEIINSTSDDEDDYVKDLFTEENFSRFKNMVTASLFKDYFERAQDSIRHSLFTQYRMHSDIMNIINRFYDGRLNNGLDKETEDRVKNHDLTIRGVDGTRFITPEKHAYWIDSSRLPNEERFYESRPVGSTSAENILECFLIIELLKKMADEYREKGYNKDNQKTVGVISFYQLQVNRIRAMLKKEKNGFDFSPINIDINTVDRFQGKEKQIIITSLVRNVKNYKRSEGSHIAAFERINVAFSRAQEMLVIVGAKDMYADQPVKLPNMDSLGEKTVYVYKNIIEELNRKACYFGSNKLLKEEYGGKIKDFMDEEYK